MSTNKKDSNKKMAMTPHTIRYPDDLWKNLSSIAESKSTPEKIVTPSHLVRTILTSEVEKLLLLT